MNCQNFGNVIVDLARSQPLDPGIREDALAHTSGCVSCAARLAEEKLLTAGLQALANDVRSSDAPAHQEQNLVSALRQQRFASQRAAVSNKWRYMAIAAAVVCAVTLAIAVLRMRPARPVESRTDASPPVKTQTPDTPKPPQTKADNTPKLKKETPKVAAKHQSKKRRTGGSMGATFVSVVVGEVTDTQPVASPYMPLGYTNAANFQDGAQVVRVELPRYAMARFGLPVNMERYDERVKADVWVGADGLAQAIRFVQ